MIQQEKHQASQWKSPKPKRAKQLKSKVMLILFFDVIGRVHREFLPQGRTINPHFCKENLCLMLHSARKETRVVAGQIMAASRQQCTNRQRLDHPGFHEWEDYRLTGATFLFKRSCSVWLFSFFPGSRGSSRGTVLMAWWISREP